MKRYKKSFLKYKDTPKYITNLARKMRLHLTLSEKILWDKLSNKKLNGLKFRRQFPIGRYIVDFYNNKNKLVIEVDGNIHNAQKEYDKNKDSYLQASGYHVLRFSDNEILNDIENVLKKILQKCIPIISP